MDQLISTARNIRLGKVEHEDGKPLELKAEIEAVLTVMDRQMEFVGTGLVNVEKTRSLRFGLSVEGARTLAKHFEEWAADAEKLEETVAQAISLPQGG